MAILGIGFKIVVALIIAAALWYIWKWAYNECKAKKDLFNTITDMLSTQMQLTNGKVKKWKKDRKEMKKEAIEADYKIKTE